MTATSERNNNNLSADIHLLGDLLGTIIAEQHGDSALELVETIRLDAKARRAGDPEAGSRLEETINRLDLESRRVLTKAFSNYFQLINIAEDQERIRVLRQREADDRIRDGIGPAVRTLHEAGLDATAVRDLVERISVRLVLTAHPSEAKRKEVLLKLRHIAGMIADLNAPRLLSREQRRLEGALAEEIEELWQTRANRAARTTVADEVDFGIYFITTTLMDIALDIHDDLVDALKEYYPAGSWDDLPPFLRYASWVGGDRDGNPNVTPQVTLDTLDTLRKAAQEVYLRELIFLRDHLTQSVHEVPVSDALRESIPDDEKFTERFPGEFYRQKAGFIYEKLAEGGYKRSDALLADLYIMEESLRENRGSRVAAGVLRRMIRKVASFGMHLAPLEVREDARLHAAALHEIFAAYEISEDYQSLPEAEKQALLTHEIDNRRPLFPPEPSFSEGTNRIIETWRMIGEAHRTYSPRVIDTVIASQSQFPSDVLAMLLLAKEVGIDAAVDIVPLFESVDDLRNAPDTMKTLFDNPTYYAHLEARQMCQQIMLGYSDSAKDGGYLASNWSLYNAQQKLAELCDSRGVTLELFHGRGGSIGRGGGPTNRAILSHPPAAMHGGRIKITEQGEVIAYRYSNHGIAHRHLSQVVHATLIATGAPQSTAVMDEWLEAMGFLSERGREVFREFVYENPHFLDYWQQATPINELAYLPISSRPTKRKKKGGFGAIRAIPWVFSWMQSRAIIPSWYGVGTALANFCDENPNGLSTLRRMFQDWIFFKVLVENVQLDLAKADMGIAALYASLVQDQGVRSSVLGAIQNEHGLACRMICEILEQTELMDNMPVIQRSIERRNPYVDPLNFIQVALLRELRDLEPDTPAHEKIMAVMLDTINGIAAGMKTTG